jgi:hypothetical protein
LASALSSWKLKGKPQQSIIYSKTPNDSNAALEILLQLQVLQFPDATPDIYDSNGNKAKTILVLYQGKYFWKHFESVEK